MELLVTDWKNYGLLLELLGLNMSLSLIDRYRLDF